MNLLGIFKDDCLTIVINQMDRALIPLNFGDKPISRCELVAGVRQHLCTNVCMCWDQDLPENCVIPVCGTWAFYSRAYSNGSVKEALEPFIDKEMSRIMSILDKSKKDAYAEYTTEQKASALLGSSNIKSIEYR